MKHVYLEDFLRANGTEYRLVVQNTTTEGVVIYIHPMNRDGDTFDCYVNGDMTTEKQAFDNLYKAIFHRSLHEVRKKIKSKR